MSVSCALLQQDSYTATAFQVDDSVCSQSTAASEPSTSRKCKEAHLDEHVIVKTKVENIWKGNAVQLLALEEWQSLEHEDHLC